MVKELTCVRCPLSCKVKIEYTKELKVLEVSGNKCPRGREYAIQEISDPHRILVTSVKVKNGKYLLASVKTSEAIPLRLFNEAMKIIEKLEVEAPVKKGDIIINNFLNTKANLIITRSVERL
ncbi:molybdopterin oxidoreductase [Marinitoga sp. 1154]|nr:molybdopterin oxidoreductase [Marinitoga sp. 1154]